MKEETVNELFSQISKLQRELHSTEVALKAMTQQANDFKKLAYDLRQQNLSDRIAVGKLQQLINEMKKVE